MIMNDELVNITWNNYPGINGYGDALNRLSYHYRKYENQTVSCSYRDKYENWRKVNFIRKQVFKRNSNFLLHSTTPRFFTRDNSQHHVSPTHNYWPARIMHDSMPSGKIAFHFYRNNYPSQYQSLLLSDMLNTKIYAGLNLDDLRNDIYWAGYDLVSLYDINDYHGFNVIENAIDCIRTNMYILQECDYYVGSEGFTAHLCRAMHVPGVFYRNDKESKEYKIIENSLEQSIHNMVCSNTEIKKKVLAFSHYMSHH
jgi:hypothetical protein